MTRPLTLRDRMTMVVNNNKNDNDNDKDNDAQQQRQHQHRDSKSTKRVIAAAVTAKKSQPVGIIASIDIAITNATVNIIVTDNIIIVFAVQHSYHRYRL